MNVAKSSVVALVVLLSGQLAILGDDQPKSQPAIALEFKLTSTDGQPLDLTRRNATRVTVVCFLGAECPLARLYGPRLAQLSTELSSKGVRFIGIDSNSQDSIDDVREYIRQHDIPFPIAKDEGNLVADRYGATRTPHVFVLDDTLNIRYRGRIDGQYEPGVSRASETRADLRIAIEELLEGKPVSVPETKPTGCLIGRVKRPATATTTNTAGDLTYCNQISRILNRHCVECHRAGEIGPFALTNYDEVRGWGEMIVEVIDQARMPPWHANPSHGKFSNARSMPAEDKQALRDWVAAGMPYGDAKQLPSPAKFVSGWQLPHEPDQVVAMRDRPYAIPATGTVEYQYFVVDPEFTEDHWISAAEVIPGNRSVVHHAIVFIRPPDGARFRGMGWVTAYVPGQRAMILPTGYARRVPAGSKLIFQMHYTPNGAPQQDITKVGMTFIPAGQVTHEVYSLVGLEQEFEIPPFTANHAVQGRLPWFPSRGELLAIAPHMHVRGQSFELVARHGEEKEILLDVPRYDFNWQHVYALTKPRPLSSIDALEFTVRFDNSQNNPVNPDPSKHVTWGDQTWEEMAVAFFEIAEPREKPAEQTSKAAKANANESDLDAKATNFVNDFFSRFDLNHDGVVVKTETSAAFREYAFRRYDVDNDGRLTRDEIESAARQKKRR